MNAEGPNIWLTFGVYHICYWNSEEEETRSSKPLGIICVTVHERRVLRMVSNQRIWLGSIEISIHSFDLLFIVGA